ncbi:MULTISPECIES: hypothetical protein [unclassified Coleofasciculus]|uniref:hypothetical protein n=1 Tax=unclassified Coleofasciculus TaxID=2692782 RepID=UPI0018830241|nr:MULTISPECIES: hypothetical protein [unclassified Coleofasciculus]MBE9126944.1 hypothetical protein [Coleofasciculus sp. LEGE 07081]MBE9150250.1 hypothetical protein [Coleofasciculus sp. LEGE 07092]
MQAICASLRDAARSHKGSADETNQFSMGRLPAIAERWHDANRRGVQGNQLSEKL